MAAYISSNPSPYKCTGDLKALQSPNRGQKAVIGCGLDRRCLVDVQPFVNIVYQRNGLIHDLSFPQNFIEQVYSSIKVRLTRLLYQVNFWRVKHTRKIPATIEKRWKAGMYSIYSYLIISTFLIRANLSRSMLKEHCWAHRYTELGYYNSECH